jgi:hypothetical protein
MTRQNRAAMSTSNKAGEGVQMLDLSLGLHRIFGASGADAHSATQHDRFTARKALAETFLSAPPSAKIRYAIDDLQAAESSSNYDVTMGVWHAQDHDGACRVCLAGAVLANRHPIRPDQIYVGPFVADGPGEYSAGRRWDDIFLALDELRTGNVHAFLKFEGTAPEEVLQAIHSGTGTGGTPLGDCIDYISYDRDPLGFKTWARAVAANLEARGC